MNSTRGCQAPHEHTRPFVTILIPTFNRAPKLRRLLFDLWLKRIHLDPEFEILCVDNRSTDRTPVLLRRAQRRMPRLRVHRQDTHLPTAEQNINASVRLAQGEYVWILGDDDEIIDANHLRMIPLIRQFPAAHFFLFNAELESGERLVRQSVSVQEARVEDLVCNYGFTTACACISITVIRRSVFPRFDDMISVSPIYAHVATYLADLGELGAVFIDLPLIRHRTSTDSLQRFDELATTFGKPFYYFWTVGLVRLFKQVEQARPSCRGLFFRVRESGSHGTFCLCREVFAQLLRQTVLAIRTQRADALFSADDEQEMADYLSQDRHFRHPVRLLSHVNRRVRDTLDSGAWKRLVDMSTDISGPIRSPDVLADEVRQLDDLFRAAIAPAAKRPLRTLRRMARSWLGNLTGRLKRGILRRRVPHAAMPE